MLNTISDSKETFYKEFPFVIPHVFRRVADEMLVELHLLSHQKNFKLDELSSLGITSAFKDLTKGYKPKDHLEKLFHAICICNGYDASRINNTALNKLDSSSKIKVNDIKSNFIEKTDNNLKIIFSSENKYYTRLTSIGIYKILENIIQKDSDNKSIDITEVTKEIGSDIGYSKDRIEKDINLYLASVEKLKQAIELIDMINKKNK